MKDLVGAGLGFIAVAVILAIGTGIVVMTNSTVTNVTGNSTLLTSVINGVGSTLTTFSSMLPILGLAIVGGLALAYVLGFFRAR